MSSSEFPGTINLIVRGEKVESKNVSDSFGTITFNYRPTVLGSATVEAQVIDSVLYSSNTQGASVNFVATAPTPTVPGPTN
jgi:hypothetical protein